MDGPVPVPLQGRRILVTQAADFIGPVLCEVLANPRFQDRLQREVPLGRLVSAREDAGFVAYLCSDAANCFVGQVFPVSGGWAVR